MAISQVGSPTAGFTAGTSISATLPQAATAGNVIVIAIGGSKGSLGAPTITISGYTEMGGVWQNSGTLSGGTRLFAKIAAGGETGATISSSSSITGAWVALELTGVDTGTFPVGPTAPATYTSNATTGLQTMNSNTRITAAADEYLVTVCGGRGPSSGDVTLSFGGGASGLYTTPSGALGFIYVGGQSVAAASTSVTHTATLTNNQGSPVNAIGTVAFKAANTDATVVVPDPASATASALVPTLSASSTVEVPAPATASAAAIVPTSVSGGSGYSPTTARSLRYSLNRLAGTLVNGVPTLDEQGAANIWVGTSGLDLVHALNVEAGNSLPDFKELQGVLNQLAGTTGLGVDAAATAIVA